jgi:hypothetical protein
MRYKLWTEGANHVEDVENLLVASRADEPAYRKFFEEDLPKMEYLRQFGEIAVIKSAPSIKGKLQDRGIPVMYLGRARNHAADTYRFLHLSTNRVWISRDVIWLNKVYGEYKGLTAPVTYDTVTVVPTDPVEEKCVADSTDGDTTTAPNASDAPIAPTAPVTRAATAAQPRADGPRTRSRGPVTVETEALRCYTHILLILHRPSTTHYPK